MTAFQTAFTHAVDRFEQELPELHSIAVCRHGREIAHCYRAPYGPEYVHMLNSLSKSYTSVGALFAMQDGLISPDDPVTRFFPECETCENMKKMKVRHLLNMSSGHSPQNADFVFRFQDGVSAFLTSDVATEPGGAFNYNTGATYMVSAIVKRVTGLPVYEYLKPRLFDKIGVSGIRWESDANGIPHGGVGLYVHTGDILKLGQFLLQKGVWNGERLLDECWIEQATSRQISNGSGSGSDWAMGYGWQFWRCQPEDVYRGDGAFGQLCVVLPRQDAVIAVTAGLGDMQKELDILWEMLPALEEENESETFVLERGIATAPAGASLNSRYLGRRYQLIDNALGLKSVTLASPNELVFTRKDGFVYRVLAGEETWVANDTGLKEDQTFPFHIMLLRKVGASCGAVDADTAVFKLCGLESAYIQTIRLAFAGDRLALTFEQTCGGKMEIMGSIFVK